MRRLVLIEIIPSGIKSIQNMGNSDNPVKIMEYEQLRQVYKCLFRCILLRLFFPGSICTALLLLRCLILLLRYSLEQS